MHPSLISVAAQERAAEVARNVERMRLLRRAEPHRTGPGLTSLFHRVRERLGAMAAPSRRPDRRPTREPGAKLHADSHRG